MIQRPRCTHCGLPILVVDLFAGPGGWDEGFRLLTGTSAPIVGVEWDLAACQTARAAGHNRVGPTTKAEEEAGAGDVSAVPLPRGYCVRGVIASPPCQGWSRAGKGKSRLDQDNVRELCNRMARGIDNHDFTTWEDERSSLAAEPVRWVRELSPEWIALEQVPDVLPLWEHQAMIFRGWGYNVWTGNVVAADYGVPQTRKRALLLGSRKHRVGRPAATHAKDADQDSLLGGGSRQRWVSMGESLGWAGTVGFPRRANSRDAATEDGYRARDLRSTGEPAQTVTGKARSWTLRRGSQAHASVRTGDEPAPTILFGNDAAGARWVMRGSGFVGGSADRSSDEPSPTITGKGTAVFALNDVPGPDGRERVNSQSGTPYDEGWPWARPSTTVAGRGLIPHPGETANRHNGSTKSRNDGVRVSVAEAATLQSFPTDYPWRGSRSAQFRQVGDAVPPLLAAHVLAVLGVGEVPADLVAHGWRAATRAGRTCR